MGIYETFTRHKIAGALGKISRWLDAHTKVLGWVEVWLDDERCAKTLPRNGLYQPSACGEELGDRNSKWQGC